MAIVFPCFGIDLLYHLPAFLASNFNLELGNPKFLSKIHIPNTYDSFKSFHCSQSFRFVVLEYRDNTKFSTIMPLLVITYAYQYGR